ncbi:MAG TPA: DsbC family protein [Steroidobacteraceae bacterium]|nr:DsbC family protein [Steroidobacteraceae bacterium]
MLLVTGMVASAAPQGAPDAATLATIKSRIETGFPDVHVKQVRPAPWGALYELVTDTELAYTTADAAVIFSGNIIDVQSKRNLSRERFNELRAIDWNSLPLDLAVKIVKGDGSRQLAVFEDPLCPYCQQLEAQLKDVTNVTIYTFLFPLESLHPGATEKARQIWCSADRAATWTAWMLGHAATPSAADCDTRGLTATRDLGATLKVDSTPTLFFTTGRRVTGALDKDSLEQQLGAAQAQGGGGKAKVSAATVAGAPAPPG